MAFFRRKLLAAPTALVVVLLGTVEVPSVNSQSTGSVYLPDPTPRDRDLHDRYSDSPAQQQQRARMAAMRRNQLQAQAAANTDEILLLAQQLRAHRTQRADHGSAPSDTLTAQKIESLAKKVKENLQSR